MWKLLPTYLSIIYLTTADPSKISPQLEGILQSGQKASVVVYFKSGIESTLKTIPKMRSGGDRGLHIKSIVDALEKNAATSQDGVIQILSARSGGADEFRYFKRYPTSNIIYIKDATLGVIQKIAEDPQVSRISEEPIVELVEPLQSASKNEGETPPENKDEVKYNFRLIQLQEAWEELGGNKGEGILIGSIDTGVRATHEALKDNFVGLDYGYFDSVEGNPVPTDSVSLGGHGTGVLGIMVGRTNGVGIAPSAKWMTCKACAKRCPYEALRDCIKWIECPTLFNGSNPDCSKAPRIINNSWTSVRGENGYKEDMMRWRSMGIIPVFAAGNKENKCNSSTAPGEYSNVISVGNTDKHDILDLGSSIGPAPDGTLKPDLVAPGVNVIKPSANGDDKYWGFSSGTSFSAPHVSGIVALLLVRNPDLTYEEAYEFLTQNTDHTVNNEPIVDTCYEESNATIPNNFVGHGRLNALKVLKAQTAKLKQK